MPMFALLEPNIVANPVFTIKPIVGRVAVKKAPSRSLNITVIESPLTKECEASSNVSVFDVHPENGSFFKTHRFQIG